MASAQREDASEGRETKHCEIMTTSGNKERDDPQNSCSYSLIIASQVDDQPRRREFLRTKSETENISRAMTAITRQKHAPRRTPRLGKSESRAGQPENSRWKRVKIGISKIQGKGLFLEETVAKGEFVIPFRGKMVSEAEVNVLELFYRSHGIGEVYFFSLNNGSALDATLRRTPAKYVNHSCNPNLEARVAGIQDDYHLNFFSRRRILQGEELTLDYMFEYQPGEERLRCLCGSKRCLKYIDR